MKKKEKPLADMRKLRERAEKRLTPNSKRDIEKMVTDARI